MREANEQRKLGLMVVAVLFVAAGLVGVFTGGGAFLAMRAVSSGDDPEPTQIAGVDASATVATESTPTATSASLATSTPTITVAPGEPTPTPEPAVPSPTATLPVGQPTSTATPEPEASGLILVADTAEDIVRAFADDGSLAFSIGEVGSNDAAFHSGSGIAIAPNEDIFIADTSGASHRPHKTRRFVCQHMGTARLWTWSV